MILSFMTSNVRSIKDKVEFNLESVTDREHEESLISFGKQKYPRFVSIYGNNGSGKSSYLFSLLNLQNLVVSNNIIQPGNMLLRTPHKLALEEPTEYSITFETHGVRYTYEISYTNEKILKESLYYAPNGRLGKIFQREDDVVSYPAQFSFLTPLIENIMNKNRLLLSVASNNSKNIEIQNAFLFIKEELVIYIGNSNRWIDYSAKKISEDSDIKKRIISFMNENGMNIEDIDVKQKVIPVNMLNLPQDLPEILKQQILSNPAVSQEIKLKHAGFWLDLKEESSGTQKMINFLCPMIDILETGKVFICDEIERHLHPLIFRKIIKNFVNNKQSSAQFICTTHDIDLLDLSFLRRDQIWFTKLGKAEHKTKLYSLADLKGIRKDENLKKNYLEEKY